MHQREKSAIAATLSNDVLVSRVRDVAGRDVGDPLNIPQDSVKLREQFDLTVEFTRADFARSTVFAFNDEGIEAAIKANESFGLQHWGRRAVCVAVASMWTPQIGAAARRAIDA
jgi:hypothetical protein